MWCVRACIPTFAMCRFKLYTYMCIHRFCPISAYIERSVFLYDCCLCIRFALLQGSMDQPFRGNTCQETWVLIYHMPHVFVRRSIQKLSSRDQSLPDRMGLKLHSWIPAAWDTSKRTCFRKDVFYNPVRRIVENLVPEQQSLRFLP